MLWLILGVIVVACLWLWKHHSVPKGFPPGPWGLPIVGYLPFLGKTAHLTFTQLSKKYGNIFGLRIGNFNIVILNDCNTIREALKDDRLSWRPDVELYNVWGGSDKTETSNHHRYGVFLSDSHVWQEQRMFLMKNLREFGYGNKGLEDILQDELKEVIVGFRNEIGNRKCDVCYPVTSLVINTIWMIINGTRWSYNDPKLKKMAEDALNDKLMLAVYPGTFYLLPQLVRLFPKFFGLSWTECVDPVDDFRKFLTKKVSEHEETYQPDSVRDFMDVYLHKIKSTTDQQSSFYGEQGVNSLVTVLMDFYSVGVNSIGPAILWAILYLSSYPETMKKLQEEIDSVIGKDRMVSLEDKKNMPYAEAVLNETFRLSTISAIGDLHRASKDIQLGGYLIPEDTLVMGNLHAVLHDSNIWENPEEFIPERFIDGEGQSKKYNEFIPFGTGKRSCVGESLTRLVTFYILIGILQHFDLSLPVGENPPSLESRGGMLVMPQIYQLVLRPH